MPVPNPSIWFGQWRTRAATSAQRWGLALGADLALLNASRLDCLHTGHPRDAQRESLEYWWHVTDVDDLRDQLNDLFICGQSGLFSAIVRCLRERVSFEAESEPERFRAEFVERRRDEALACGHVRAFDLGRVPNLARFGYTAGYIDAPEAWKWTARAAAAAQPLFPSWRAFAANYRLGHEFWDAAEPDTATDYFAHREFLFQAPASPWVSLPWRTPLDA